MIIKSFELNKLELNNYKFYLFYGDNEGSKEETIKNLFEKNYPNKIYRYEEKEKALKALQTDWSKSDQVYMNSSVFLREAEANNNG